MTERDIAMTLHSRPTFLITLGLTGCLTATIALGEPGREQFKQIDTNQDGVISFDEFSAEGQTIPSSLFFRIYNEAALLLVIPILILVIVKPF